MIRTARFVRRDSYGAIRTARNYVPRLLVFLYSPNLKQATFSYSLPRASEARIIKDDSYGAIRTARNYVPRFLCFYIALIWNRQPFLTLWFYPPLLIWVWFVSRLNQTQIPRAFFSSHGVYHKELFRVPYF